MRKFTLLLSFIVIAIVDFQAMAVPALPGFVVFTQPDGTTVTIQLVGDENLSYVYSQDGYTLLKKNGYYYYATHNQTGDLVASEYVARDIHNKSTDNGFLQSIDKGLGFSKTQLAARPIKRHPLRNENNLKASGIQSSTFPPTGKRKLLMILVNFSDTQVNYPKENFEKYMNEKNYNGKGSFRDFFLENSYGQLDIETTVTKWVTVSKGHDYYGRDDDAHAYEILIEAINLLDDDLNFKDFDNDNDGFVDGISIIHQGQGEEFTGSDENNIWSHSWTLGSALHPANPPRKDGVYINSYTIQPEIRAGKGATSMSTIGVICHEFGHNLGAPDYYDTSESGSNNGTGQWDLMAAGSWNGNSGDRPAHVNGYQKSEYGWLALKELSDSEAFVLKPVVDEPEVYKINSTTAGEFFVLENRQQKGVFDQALPGNGMIIYHVDENSIRQAYYNNEVNVGLHQGLFPIVASGSMRNPNTSACPFPGRDNVTSFTDQSTPSSLSWAGENTNRPITNIKQTGENISFSVSTSLPICVAPTELTASYTGANKVNLKWVPGNDAFYSLYNVYRNDILVASKTNTLEYNDLTAPNGVNRYAVTNISTNNGCESDPLSTSVFCGTTNHYLPLNVVASNEMAKVTLSWSSPIKRYDGFEEMAPFELNQAGSNNWSYIDKDNQPTHAFGVSFQNSDIPKSIICFNPSKTEPPITDVEAKAFVGLQYMAGFSASDETSVSDDWMISDELKLTKPHILVFHAKYYRQSDGMNKMNVGLSKTGKEQSAFEFINGNQPVELNQNWTRYEFAIPADTKYLAINFQSSNGATSMMDEIFLLENEAIQPMTEYVADLYPPTQITGYNVYRNSTLIHSNIQELSISDNVPLRGSYEYTIEALAGSKIPMASVKKSVFVNETSIEQPLATPKEVVIYPNPANGSFNVRCDGHSLESVHIYSIAGNLVLKANHNENINIANLPIGYYIVKIKTNIGQFVKRLQIK